LQEANVQSRSNGELHEEHGPGEIGLTGLYWRNLGPIPPAFFIVVVLNLFTPLRFFDELKAVLGVNLAYKLFLFAPLFVIVTAGILQYFVQRPIAKAMKELGAASEIENGLRESARRRVLNLPFILALCNLVLIALLPAIALSYFHYVLDLSARSALFLFFRAVIIAMISATLSFFWVEEFLRKSVIATFFPEGKLATVLGTIRTSVRLRIWVLYLGGTIVPMIVLLGTLLFNFWTLKVSDVSPVKFGREIIVFSLILYGIFFFIALSLTSMVERSVVGIVDAMLKVIDGVKKGDFSKKIRVVSNDELGRLADASNDMIGGLSEREMIRDTFGKYVTPEIRDEILAGRVPLNGKRAEATMLFCDLRNFTPFVEENDPEEVIMSMRDYFTAMQVAIGTYDGLVLQYVGDEIEAVFGVPLLSDEHPNNAVLAAFEMRAGLKDLNDRRLRDGKSAFRHGIGIHTGEVLAGNTGSADRLSYALIGNTVNLASRIQGLTKEFACDLLISEETAKRLTITIPLEKQEPRLVKGYSKPLTLYTVA
jgi:adenylate cyclase